MKNTNNICPYCGCELKKNSSFLVCMHCGHSLTPEKHFDNVDPKLIEKSDNKVRNIFFSLNSLWWILLVIGSLVTTIVSFSLLFKI